MREKNWGEILGQSQYFMNWKNYFKKKISKNLKKTFSKKKKTSRK